MRVPVFDRHLPEPDHVTELRGKVSFWRRTALTLMGLLVIEGMLWVAQ